MYMSPEVVAEAHLSAQWKEEDQKNWQRADVYSFAMVAYEIMTGQYPWPLDAHIQSLVMKERPMIPSRGYISYNCSDEVPADISELIQDCWALLQERPYMDNMFHRLKQMQTGVQAIQSNKRRCFC